MSNFDIHHFPPPRRDEPLPPPLPRPAPPYSSAPNTAPETAPQRRRRSGLPAAVWIGLIGAGLVVLAVLAVVISRWDTLGRSIRAVLVVAAATATLLAAGRLRRIAPTMATLIAHLGAGLVTAAGISTGAMLGLTWPLCLVVGGLAGFAAAVALTPHWTPSWFGVGEVINAALVAVGLAAWAGTAAGTIAAVMAIGFVATGRNRRGALLVTAALFSPLSAILAALDVGPGTLQRAGLVGDRLAWSGPIVGVIAAAILLIVAQRLAKPSLSTLGVLAPVVGIATALAVTDSPIGAWWALPGVALILLEVANEFGPARSDERTTALNVSSGTVLVTALLATMIWDLSLLVASRSSSAEAFTPGPNMVFALVATIVGLALSVRRWRGTTAHAADAGIAVIAGLVANLLVAVGSDPNVIVFGSAALVVGAIAVSRTRGPIAVDTTALGALVMFAAYVPSASTTELVLYRAVMALMIGLVIVVRIRNAPPSRSWGTVELVGIYAIAWLQVLAVWSVASPAALALVVVSAAALLGTLIDRRAFDAQTIAVGALGSLTALSTLTAYARDLSVDGLVWVSLSVVVLSFAIAWWRYRIASASDIAAAAVVAVVATAGTQVGLAASELLAMMLTIAIALSGVTAVLGRRSPFDVAGPTATILAAACIGPSVSSMAISFVAIAFGIQIVIIGYRYANDIVVAAGTIVTVVGIASLWWTTPLNAWLNRVLEPIAASTADLAALTATLLLIGVGIVTRRRRRLTSWVAYTPGLVVGGLWLTVVSSDRVTFWAAPLGLALGVGAVGAGAWRRLASPLVLGTAIVVAIVVTSYSTYLGDVPMWVWLALGGTTLIGLAVVIERKSGEGSRLADLIARWE